MVDYSSSVMTSFADHQRLSEDDLPDILRYLEQLSPKWKKVGVYLGLSPSRLDKIECSETDLDCRLFRMVTDWLRGNYNEDKFGCPSWLKLASVVKTMDGRLAHKISYDHSDQHLTQERIRTSKGRSQHHTKFPCGCIKSFWRGQQHQVEDQSDLAGSPISSVSNRSAKLDLVSDPTTLINPFHTSYHGELTGSIAEQKLRTQGGNCYLTRYSNRRKSYVLSVHYVKGTNAAISHFRVLVECNKIWLDQEEGKFEFESLGHLLHHYQRNPLNHKVKSIGSEYRKAEDLSKQEPILGTWV